MTRTRGLGGFRQDLVCSPKVAPPGTPLLDALLWHANVAAACRIADEIHAAEDAGMLVDLDEGPVFPECTVGFIGHPAGLGGLCASVNQAIEKHFQDYDLTMPRDLHTVITTGAMVAGNFHQALGYLLRWVAIEMEDD